MQKFYDPYYLQELLQFPWLSLNYYFFWKISLLYYMFCFLTPFKDGIVHVTKVWAFLLQDKERQGKQSSPWKITVRTCQRQDGVNLITCFPLAGCTQGRHRFSGVSSLCQSLKRRLSWHQSCSCSSKPVWHSPDKCCKSRESRLSSETSRESVK